MNNSQETKPKEHELPEIKVGIIGTGFIADLHMESLKRIPGIRVIGCCDVDKGRADSFARRWNLSSSCDDITFFLEGKRFDVVHVLVPPNYHYSIAKQILERGVDVFLEKPMGITGDQCQKLIKISQRNGTKIGLNHNFVFYPLFKTLEKDLSSHRIGKPEYVIAFYGGPLGQLDSGKFGNWMFQEPGNIILEQGPHPISQIRAILGEIQEITATATGKRELGKDQFFYDRWQAIMKCKEGNAFVHLSFGNQFSAQRTLYVYGQDGAILVDFLNNRYLLQEKSIFPDYLDPTANAMRYLIPAFEGVKDFLDYAFSKVKLKDRTDPYFLSIKNSLTAFYDAYRLGTGLPCSGEDGLKVVEACEEWIEAAALPKNPGPVVISKKVEEKVGEEVLVTGATGFIGRHLVKNLVARGRRVRVLVRNSRGLRAELYSPLVHVVEGDITDQKTIGKAVQGVQFVYHLAHGLGQGWEDFLRLNVAPARYLAEACIKEKVTYLIFASTIATYYYGDVPKGRAVDGSVAIDSKPELRNFYARSKIVIENMLMEMFRKDNLPLVIFRPGIVVGEGGTLYHGGIGEWTRDNVCAYWGWGANELPFVLVDDVATAMLKIMDLEGLTGKTFNLVGDVRFTAREYITYLRKYSHRNIKAFPYPTVLCFLSDTFKYLIKWSTGDRNALLSYRDLANRSIQGHFDCETEKRLLLWQPCNNRNEFVTKAIGWAFRG
jgi:predicted dehydrogenase/nucleoside-diphosphate-sugar epimerase